MVLLFVDMWIYLVVNILNMLISDSVSIWDFLFVGVGFEGLEGMILFLFCKVLGCIDCFLIVFDLDFFSSMRGVFLMVVGE